MSPDVSLILKPKLLTFFLLLETNGFNGINDIRAFILFISLPSLGRGVNDNDDGLSSSFNITVKYVLSLLLCLNEIVSFILSSPFSTKNSISVSSASNNILGVGGELLSSLSFPTYKSLLS